MNNHVYIAYASSDYYAPYLGVSIKSLILNSNSKRFYTVYILDNGITDNKKKKLMDLQAGNVEIRFIDMNKYLKNVDISMFYIYPPYTISTYLRFFLPEVFLDFDKVLFIDSDTIIRRDVSELFDCDLDNNFLAAVEDFEVKRMVRNDYSVKKYLQNVLKFENTEDYFQAGVLLFNLKEMRSVDFTEKCLNTLKELKKTMFLDQCILNYLCKKSYLKINPSWNVEWHLLQNTASLDTCLEERDFLRYSESFNEPFIIHYTSSVKPWCAPELPLAEYFWYYARLTPFYEEILFLNISQKPENKKLCLGQIIMERIKSIHKFLNKEKK